MVTLTAPETREELSRLVEDTQTRESLDNFIRSLTLTDHEEGMIIDSLRILPDCRSNLEELPEEAPDLITMVWWR